MICDHYKHALVELAAAGAEPDQELHAHLQACDSCRSLLESERSLFASIDSYLRSSANADIPPSFIPTVRVRLQQESALAPGSPAITDRLLWVPALVAAAMILFVFTRLNHRVQQPSTDEQAVTQQADSPVALPTTPATAKPLGESVPKIGSAIEKSSASPSVIPHKKRSAQSQTRQAEILVPPDQEILLARYVEHWSRHRQSPPVLQTESAPDHTDPPQLQLIQISALDVKPLAPLADEQEYGQEQDRRQK
jgi:hypothetical protein